MKYILPILFLLGTFISSCVEKETSNTLHQADLIDTLVVIPNKAVDKSLLVYHHETSVWTWNDQGYSGYLVSFYPDSTLKEKTGILKGKKQNQAVQWYPDGHLKQVAHYHQGKLHGVKKRWSDDANHVLIAQLNYHLGRAHGEQKQWYSTGELYKKLNLEMGKEEGLQQAFRRNGELYANYEAKNGRIFGLRKASLCYGLEDENIKYDQ